MTVNLINSSIISSIAAIDFTRSLRSDIYLKSGELLDFNRYFSINEFSKIYLDNLGTVSYTHLTLPTIYSV